MAYYCCDCPRNCGAQRDGTNGKGFCGAGETIDVAKVMRHMWEEPCLGGSKGVENIFLYGCNLKCVYCQNYKINGTDNTFDKEKLRRLGTKEFGALLTEAAQTGASAVGIVTGDHCIRQISEAITDDVRHKIKVPVIFNCSGYAKPETLELLRGKIDIFMPDLKYVDGSLSLDLSRASDYPSVSIAAIKKCFEMTGPAVFGSDGLLKKGVLVRHLVLPGQIRNTLGVIDLLNSTFAPGDIVFSLMSQYLPVPGLCLPEKYKRLSGRLTKAEHKKAAEYFANAENLTLGFTQDLSSSDEAFVPDF
ncbi:MAG: radical SAM protein [Clostridia bacterium]|nr:radical SAM protein [Clostridia bacterium]